MRQIGINSFKSYLEFIASKNVSGNFLSPSEFNNALPIVVAKFVRKYIGVPEQYPQPQVAYEQTSLVTDYIGHLKKEKILSIASDGTAVRPQDFMHQSTVFAANITIKEADQSEFKCCDTSQAAAKPLQKMLATMVPVTVLSDNEMASWQQSTLRTPTKEEPVCTFKGDTIQFLPRNLRSAYLSYIRYPVTPIWNYTGTSYPIYNPTGSVDIELPESCADELMSMMLIRLGMVIREEGMIKFGQYIKDSGL